MNKTIKDLNYDLKRACSKGELDKVRYYLTSPELQLHANINIEEDETDPPLTKACANGHIEVVKYLLTSKELFEHADINAENGSALAESCWNGHFNIIKYLLTSPSLKTKADLNISSISINYAAAQGHLEIVDYLLTSSEIKQHSKINNNDINLSPIVRAAAGNHVEVVKFLTSSNKLKEYSDQKSIEKAFKVAFNEEKLDVLKYFILEYNLKKTSNIEKFLGNNYNEYPIGEVNDWFEKRRLNNELNVELDSKFKSNDKRIKI